MNADAQAELREVERQILLRRPEHSIEPSLDRIRELTGLLGDPQPSYPVIHNTGTNGKTPTPRMAQTLLRPSARRTWIFTRHPPLTLPDPILLASSPLSA